MVECGGDLLNLATISLHDESVALVTSVHVAEDAALRVKQESINAMARGKVANVIRDHAVQPARAVGAGERDPGAEAEVIDSAGVVKSCELLLRIGKAWRSGGSAVLGQSHRLGDGVRVHADCVEQGSVRH